MGEGLTYSQFCRFLEDDNIVEWLFQFWDNEKKCWMMIKLERFNPIEGAVTIIALASSLEVNNKCSYVEVARSTRDSAGVVSLFCSQEEVSVLETPLRELRLSYAVTFDGKVDFQSTLLEKEVLQLYVDDAKDLQKEFKSLLLMTVTGAYRLRI